MKHHSDEMWLFEFKEDFFFLITDKFIERHQGMPPVYKRNPWKQKATTPTKKSPIIWKEKKKKTNAKKIMELIKGAVANA